MNSFSIWHSARTIMIIVFTFHTAALAQQLIPGKNIEITFAQPDVPHTLFTMMTGTPATPCLTIRLPDDYDSTKIYPLLVYVPGFHGGPKGNIGNAQTIAGPKGWIVASLPLFKESIDTSEPGGGIIIGFQDYPVISRAYRIILGKIFELVPNIDQAKSALVGFSNGALTIAILVSNQDEFILAHFKNFCIIDHGMFHLTDLHKKHARDCRFLVLVGDKKDYGRDLKIKGSQLLQEEWKSLGVNLEYQIMEDTGHEFYNRQMALVGRWLRNEDISKSPALKDTISPNR
jgi:hypothetical protein